MVRPFLACLMISFTLPAQATTPSPSASTGDDPTPRVITVQNLAPFPRDEWVVASVPFAEGQVLELPKLRVRGAAHTVWEPFGARWRDGSVRQALCVFRQKIGAIEEISATLIENAEEAESTAVPVPTTSQPSSEGDDSDTQATLPAPTLLEHTFEFVVVLDGKTERAKPVVMETLHTNAARKVVLARCRIGESGLVGEVTYEFFSGQEIAYCSVGVFFSDPSTQDMERAVQEIRVETEGAALFLRHHDLLGVETRLSGTGSAVTLIRDSYLGDGQGLRRSGSLVPPLTEDMESPRNQTICAAAVHRPLAATPWGDTGAFGAYGCVPDAPPWMNPSAMRQAFAARHSAFVARSKQPGDAFAEGAHMLGKRPSKTGEQADFGVVQLEPVASTGIPSFLYEVEASILQEACRPTHFFETNTEPVTAANHPDWIVWEGRTHYHAGMTSDRLGKAPDAETKGFEAHKWKGKKRSHWSSNYLGAYYLLTGMPEALLELRNEAQLFLAGETVDPRFVTSGSSGSRALGRTLQSASWIYLATGDKTILQRMVDRVHKVGLPEWIGREFPESNVRPYRIAKPDPRILAGKSDTWPPWINALCVIGTGAVYALTQDEGAKELTDGLALNLLRHGWRILPDGSVRIVYAMRWKADGAPLTPEEENSPEWVHLSGSLAMWSLPSIVWAKHAARERGDNELVARADDLLRRLRKVRRGRTRDGWFDRFGQWDALRHPDAPK